MAMDAGLWSPRRPHGLTATSRRARPRWRSHQTPCSPLPAMTSALGYNEDRRQLQLMDGWQASEAWRADLRAEYILSEAGGRGRRRCGVGREEDSDQRCQDFCFQNFFPKNLAKKLGRVLNGGFSGTARVRVRSCSTPPPFRADEKYRGVLPEGRISRRGIRHRWVGRLAEGPSAAYR